MNAPRYQAMIRDARRRPALWRLLLGLLTVTAVLTIWFAALIALHGLVFGVGFQDSGGLLMAGLAPGPGQTALLLGIVGGLGLGSFAAAALWQNRSPRSLIGPGAMTLRHAALAGLTTFTILIFLTLASLPLSPPPVPNLGTANWLVWLPVGLLALIVQTGGEEIFFRGYLQSQLAARLGNTGLAALLSALVFGLAHYVPTQPAASMLGYVLIAVLFGLLAADLTIRTGSIGAAWGFHFANNALAVLVISPGGSITGLARWQSPSAFDAGGIPPLYMVFEVFLLVAIWVSIRRVLRV